MLLCWLLVNSVVGKCQESCERMLKKVLRTAKAVILPMARSLDDENVLQLESFGLGHEAMSDALGPMTDCQYLLYMHEVDSAP